jgi:hypothetical protein
MGIEIAPEGTRALLEETAGQLRQYEADHRAKVENATASAETHDKGSEARRVFERLRDTATEKADRNARLAGRIEALLAGWEEAE